MGGEGHRREAADPEPVQALVGRRETVDEGDRERCVWLLPCPPRRRRRRRAGSEGFVWIFHGVDANGMGLGGRRALIVSMPGLADEAEQQKVSAEAEPVPVARTRWSLRGGCVLESPTVPPRE